MEEDSSWGLLSNNGHKTHRKQEQDKHCAPRVKKHPKDQHNEESAEGVRQLPEIKDHDWGINSLTHAVPVVTL
ncbi:hypothetical protein WDW86_05035 [Bdellovibrionota bacterium FG-2]